ncbi:hypothetical protein [Methylocystis sp.]|uniref:hypothetical protein n=1 Tax=Methylocystis sp. TaxID=1911079 RepID=UPI003DA3FE20
MTDTTTQLAILSDALVKIIDRSAGGRGEGGARRSLDPGGRHRRAGADRRRHLWSVAAVL